MWLASLIELLKCGIDLSTIDTLKLAVKVLKGHCKKPQFDRCFDGRSQSKNEVIFGSVTNNEKQTTKQVRTRERDFIKAELTIVVC